MLSLQVDDVYCEASVTNTTPVSNGLRFENAEIVILYFNPLLTHFLIHLLTHPLTHSQIDGCLEMRVESPFNINRWDCRGERLIVNATVVENGTLISITRLKRVMVTPFLVFFTTIHQDTYMKPLLPFIAKVGWLGIDSLMGTHCMSVFLLSVSLGNYFLRHYPFPSSLIRIFTYIKEKKEGILHL